MTSPLMWRGGPKRLGRSAHAIPTKRPALRWRFRARRAFHASPLRLADGSVLAASLDGALYRLAGSDGRVLWRRHLGGAIFATPLATARGIFAGSDADRLAAVDARGGGVRWTFRLGPCARVPGVGPETVRCDADSPPAALGSTGSIVFGGDALYAVSPAGKLRWRAKLAGHARAAPTVGDDGGVYVATQGQTVQAFAANGASRWTFRARGACDATPALDAGRLYLGCDDGWFYALEASSGKRLWRYRARRVVRSSAAVTYDGKLVVVGGYDGRVHALEAASGKLRWSFATGAAVHGSPRVDRAGRVLVGSRDDHLYALSEDGKQLWKIRLGGDIDGEANVGPDGTILVGADDGVLYALR